jgi:hypothetical protein
VFPAYICYRSSDCVADAGCIGRYSNAFPQTNSGEHCANTGRLKSYGVGEEVVALDSVSVSLLVEDVSLITLSASVSPPSGGVASIVVSVSTSLPAEDVASIVGSISVSPLDEDVILIVVSVSVSLLDEGVASVVVSASVSPLDEGVASAVVSASVSPLDKGVALIVGAVSGSLDVAGAGFITVVLLSLFAADGLTPVCFCSQPISNAAPAAMSMYFLTA